jgi:hypothetical protein
MSIIPATQEKEAGGLEVKVSSGKGLAVSKTKFQKKTGV